VRSVAADERNNRSGSSLGGHGGFLLLCLALGLLLGLASQEAAWAGPDTSGLRGTIPTMTPTENPNATPTVHPSATPTATLAPGVERIVLQQGVGGYDGACDTYLDFWSPSTVYGDADRLSVSSDGTRVALLRFDLSGVLGDVAVLHADLVLYALGRSAPRIATARVHRVLRTWACDEATWTHATASDLWYYPGCNGLGTDRAVLPEATEILAGVEYSYSFDVSAAVREWLAEPSSNHGLVVAADAPSTVEYRFASSAYQSVEYRPALVIIYTEGPLTPTVTPTLGPTFTPSPTPTPLTMVFQYGVSPEMAPGVLYEGARDTYVDSWHPTENYGENWKLNLRSGDVEAALIRFDLSLLPPGAYVVGAELGVYVVARSNTANLPTMAYRVLRSWVDTEATWEQASQDNPWGIAGCNGTSSDRQGVPEDAQVLGSKGISDWWYYFDVSEMARYWVEHPEANWGLILKAGETSSVEYSLASSDRPSDRQLRPKLSVRYYLHAPTPTVTETPVTPTATVWPTGTTTPPLEPTLPPGGIGGLVWDDVNGDGNIDAGERPLSGVEVMLKDDQGVVLEEHLTGTDGSYSFTNLVSDWYRVSSVPPLGYAPSTYSEVRVRPAPGVILRVDFGLRRVSRPYTVVLPMVLK